MAGLVQSRALSKGNLKATDSGLSATGMHPNSDNFLRRRNNRKGVSGYTVLAVSLDSSNSNKFKAI